MLVSYSSSHLCHSCVVATNTTSLDCGLLFCKSPVTFTIELSTTLQEGIFSHFPKVLPVSFWFHVPRFLDTDLWHLWRWLHFSSQQSPSWRWRRNMFVLNQKHKDGWGATFSVNVVCNKSSPVQRNFCIMHVICALSFYIPDKGVSSRISSFIVPIETIWVGSLFPERHVLTVVMLGLQLQLQFQKQMSENLCTNKLKQDASRR